MELITKLKTKISIAFDNGCNVNDADWGAEQGILITVKDAMLIVKHLESAQLQQHSVMQAEGSDGVSGAAVDPTNAPEVKIALE